MINPEQILSIFAVIFGLLVGSFLNVVIYRIPREENIVFPRSKCPKCSKQLAWYHNIPVISWMILRGKCAFCDQKIAWRYPFIELLTGGLAFLVFNPHEIVNSLFFFAIGCTFICIFFIDIDFKIIPDKLNLYLFFLFLVHSILFKPVTFWLLGGIIGFGFPYLITWVFYKLKNKIGLGGGDIKLFGALGIMLGPVGILSNIFLSSMLGSVVGVVLILSKKFDPKNALAFGPYIIIVAFAQIFFPDYFTMINPFIFK